ncbi:hydrogenase iron-sulfur subunit [Chloroflexota bacterium]
MRKPCFLHPPSLKIHLFCCSSSFNPAELVRCWNEQGDELKVIPLPCSGKVDILYLMKAFETGADGVAIVACKQGECRYLEGNLRARKRVEAVDGLLEELGLGKGHIVIIHVNDGGIEQVIHDVDDFRARIRALPRPVLNAEVQTPKSRS